MASALKLDGYPASHHAVIRSAFRYSVWMSTVTFLIAVFAFLSAVYWGLPAIFAAGAITVFLLYGVIGTIATVVEARSVRIIPYFSQSIGDIETYLAGHALARNLTYLDQITSQHGIRPLSDFGFNDDLRGELLVWHAAEDGFQTADWLINHLPTILLSADENNAVLDDLEKLRHALQKAKTKDVQFCLLIRYGTTTSGHEWSVRQGTAF